MPISLPSPALGLVRRQPKVGTPGQIVLEPKRFVLLVTWEETSAQPIPVIRPQSGRFMRRLRRRQTPRPEAWVNEVTG